MLCIHTYYAKRKRARTRAYYPQHVCVEFAEGVCVCGTARRGTNTRRAHVPRFIGYGEALPS